MKTFNIELIKIGREKHSESISRNFMSKALACQWAIDEASNHLMSSDIEMSDKEDGDFTVFAGMRPVGTIKIKEELEIKTENKK